MADPVTQFEAPVRIDYVVTASDVVARFLHGLLEGKFLGRQCPETGKVYMPPRGACPTSGLPAGAEVEVGPNGTVTTFSVIRIPFEGQVLQPPYACAHIVLDGADSPLLHIVGDCDVDDVRIGMRVAPVWLEEPIPSLARVSYFRPSGEPDADPSTYTEHT